MPTDLSTLHRLVGDLFSAIEAERRATAYALHDGIGQELSLLISGLRSAKDALSDPQESARCAALQQLAEKALAEARRLGFGRIILETASVLKEAIDLYKKYGFQPYHASHCAARCDQTYELSLAPA